MKNLNVEWSDIGGLTFWSFMITGGTLGWSYLVKKARDRILELVRKDMTPKDWLELVGWSIAVSSTSILFGYLLVESKENFQRVLFS